jgi:cobalt-zinc-cadmium efflux system membrane fusion protein
MKSEQSMANRFIRKLTPHGRYLISLAVIGAAGLGAWSFLAKEPRRAASQQVETILSAPSSDGLYSPTAAQWATLTVEPVTRQVFRSEHVTEGKIAVDEDRSTPVFSPYSGRIIKLLVKPGDTVVSGQALFTIEATDMVQAQNDFIAGISARNKAISQRSFAELDEKRYRVLSRDKAIPQRDFEQAQTVLTAAQNDVRAAETALEAVRNRLRILGKTDEEISAFEQTGRISPETPIYSPISGIVVSRKVGPGQYINTAVSNDANYVIGDLSTVWLVAYVRETDSAKIRNGQQISFTLLGRPGEIYRGNIKYVATTIDPNSRRLMIRTTISNESGFLKPEMYASVTIFTDEGDSWPAVPRDAVIYEGSDAHLWVSNDNHTIERRLIRPGLIDGRMIQVLEGLRPDEKVISKGSLFIDRAATGA